MKFFFVKEDIKVTGRRKYRISQLVSEFIRERNEWLSLVVNHDIGVVDTTGMREWRREKGRHADGKIRTTVRIKIEDSKGYNCGGEK